LFATEFILFRKCCTRCIVLGYSAATVDSLHDLLQDITCRLVICCWLHSQAAALARPYLCNCSCNWGTCIAPPTRRPRAYHRVSQYLGARRQNETKMFQITTKQDCRIVG